jgi:serine/threonine protein kinase
LLGQGGFADVFLYQQNTPRREVAVKVLLLEMVGTDAVARLNDEANAMAGLSQHQNIVTVFHSGVANDGRPYLVMDYYPRPSLAKNWRQAKHPSQNVLTIGVQLAGAVESAHRLGILHRDIKPANILGDRNGRPVLGDFGIAMTITAAGQGAEGLSVPWSPPEAFGSNPRATPPSDVWGLAATLYSLLTGRAPFEVPGGDNKVHAQADRIKTAPYRPLGRPDTPASLDQVLATAMAKDPRARYQTMRAFGVALQEVEQELKLPPTRLEIIDDSAGYDGVNDDDDEDPGTRLRPITVIDPTGASTSPLVTPTPLTTPGPVLTWPSMTDVPTDRSGPTAHVLPSVTSVPRLDAYEPVDRTVRRGGPGGDTGFDSGPGTWQRVSPPEAVSTQKRLPSAPASPVPVVSPAPVAAKPRARWKIIVFAGVLLVIALVVTVVIMTTERDTPTLPEPGASLSGGSDPQDPLGTAAPPKATDLVGVVEENTAYFTWVNPQPEVGDIYLWNVVVGHVVTEEGRTSVQQTEASVDLEENQAEVCIAVWIVRSSGKPSEPVAECAERTA